MHMMLVYHMHSQSRG